MRTYNEIKKQVEKLYEIENRNITICYGIIIAGCLILSIIPFLYKLSQLT